MFNPNLLPSSTNIHFAILATTITLTVLLVGNLFPSTLDFVNPYMESLSVSMAIYLVIAFWAATLFIYFAHPILCSIGYSANAVDSKLSILTGEMQSIASKFGVRNVKVIFDADIMNFDMRAFGVPYHRTIAIGRGNLLVFEKAKNIFLAKAYHEIAHIKNHDIDIGFLAQATLLSFLLFTSALGAYWYYMFLAKGYIAELTSFEFYQGLVIMFGAITSLIVPWLQLRAFIRQREYLADAEAAFRLTSHALASAIGAPGRKRTWLQRMITGISKLPAAHPSVESRLRSVHIFQRAGLPGFFLIFVIAFLQEAGGELLLLFRQQSYSWTNFFNASLMGVNFGDIGRGALADPSLSFVLAIMTISTMIVDIMIASLFLRFSLQCKLLEIGIKKKVLLCVFAVLAYASGRWLAAMPTDLSSAELGVFVDKIILSFAILLVTEVFSQFILRGKRTKRVSQFTWLGCSFVLSMVSARIYLAVLALKNYAFIYNGEVKDSDYSFLLGNLIGFLLWCGAALTLGVFIKNGTFSRRTSNKNLAPSWVCGLT